MVGGEATRPFVKVVFAFRSSESKAGLRCDGKAVLGIMEDDKVDGGGEEGRVKREWTEDTLRGA